MPPRRVLRWVFGLLCGTVTWARADTYDTSVWLSCTRYFGYECKGQAIDVQYVPSDACFQYSDPLFLDTYEGKQFRTCTLSAINIFNCASTASCSTSDSTSCRLVVAGLKPGTCFYSSGTYPGYGVSAKCLCVSYDPTNSAFRDFSPKLPSTALLSTEEIVFVAVSGALILLMIPPCMYQYKQKGTVRWMPCKQRGKPEKRAQVFPVTTSSIELQSMSSSPSTQSSSFAPHPQASLMAQYPPYPPSLAPHHLIHQPPASFYASQQYPPYLSQQIPQSMILGYPHSYHPGSSQQFIPNYLQPASPSPFVAPHSLAGAYSTNHSVSSTMASVGYPQQMMQGVGQSHASLPNGGPGYTAFPQY